MEIPKTPTLHQGSYTGMRVSLVVTCGMEQLLTFISSWVLRYFGWNSTSHTMR